MSISGGGYLVYKQYTKQQGSAYPFTVVTSRLKTNEQVALYAESQGIKPPFILHFFATWCKPCNAEHPWLLKLHNEHNIPIIAVLFHDSPMEFARWSKQHEPYFDQLIMSPEPELIQTLQVNGIPSSFVFLPSKQVARVGFNIDGSEVVEAMAKQLKQMEK